MANTVSAVTSAVLSGLFAFGGAYLATRGQLDLWQKEKRYTLQMNIFDRRVQTLKALDEVFSLARQFVILNRPSTEQSANPLSTLIYCSDATRNNEGLPLCRNAKPSPEDLKIFSEFNKLTSNFHEAELSAQIYFCTKTKAAMSQIPGGLYWWNADEEKRAAIISAMRSELFCAIKFADLDIS